MIGKTVTSIVKCISCKIISEISQIQARQFNRTHAFFSVSNSNGNLVLNLNDLA